MVGAALGPPWEPGRGASRLAPAPSVRRVSGLCRSSPTPPLPCPQQPGRSVGKVLPDTGSRKSWCSLRTLFSGGKGKSVADFDPSCCLPHPLLPLGAAAALARRPPGLQCPGGNASCHQLWTQRPQTWALRKESVYPREDPVCPWRPHLFQPPSHFPAPLTNLRLTKPS